jgi:pyruvate dehydrogenase E2 component (dihydrolipoamide acetyltransferase)/2-oxoglutarate dehydrogenase E2 component (dihydrolipoamide succinyltransferase)
MVVANMKVLLPQFGMGMQEAEIVRWLKAVGDQVETGEALVEIEAAKTTVEVPSPGSGVLKEIISEEGTTVEVRGHIATLTV